MAARPEGAALPTAAGGVPVPRLWTRDFLLICMVGFLTSVVMQIQNATLAIFVEHLQGSAAFAGLITGFFSLLAGLMRFVSGRWSDLRGRRTVMAIGAFVFGLGVFACGAFAVLPLLLLFRAVQGAGFGAVNTASGAAAADVTPRSRMGEGLGYFGLGQSLSLAVGPAIGLAFTANGNYRAMFTTAAGILGLTVVFALLCTYERRRPHPHAHPPAIPDAVVEGDPPDVAEPEPRGLWKVLDQRALPAALLQLLLCLGISSLTAFAGRFATEQGYAHAGLFFTFEAATMFAARLFVGRAFDRRGPLAVLAPALLVGAATFAGLALLHGEVLFLACGAAMGFALGITGPALQALAVRRAPHHRYGAASAAYFLATDIGIGGGSMLWGVVLDAGRFPAVFLGSALLMLVTLAAAIPMTRRA